MLQKKKELSLARLVCSIPQYLHNFLHVRAFAAVSYVLIVQMFYWNVSTASKPLAIRHLLSFHHQIVTSKIGEGRQPFETQAPPIIANARAYCSAERRNCVVTVKPYLSMVKLLAMSSFKKRQRTLKRAHKERSQVSDV